MRQKTTKRRTKSPILLRKWPIVAGAVLVIAVSSGLLYWHHQRQGDNDITEIRELILMAVEGLSVPAPVDARTGDVYFPPAKLYLPTTQVLPQITYGYEPESQTLRVSTKQVVSATGSKLYSAHNNEQLFALVPKLQACSRGLLLSPDTQQDSSLVHIGDTTVRDGRTLHVYNERQCNELNALGLQLLGVHSY
jgi:hypothetical protein